MSYGLAEEPCPVADQTLGDLYRSHQQGLSALVASVSPDVRAILALYCYRRAHLQTLGVSIAATCSEDELEEAGGHAGTALFTISRRTQEPADTQPSGRRKVSLSSGPLTALPPIDDDIDEDAEQEESRLDAVREGETEPAAETSLETAGPEAVG
jgi:hypothetical protein